MFESTHVYLYICGGSEKNGIVNAEGHMQFNHDKEKVQLRHFPYLLSIIIQGISFYTSGFSVTINLVTICRT